MIIQTKRQKQIWSQFSVVGYCETRVTCSVSDKGEGTEGSRRNPQISDRPGDLLQNVAKFLETEIIINEKKHTTLTLQLERKITLHYFILPLKSEAFFALCLSTMGFPKNDEIWTK